MAERPQLAAPPTMIGNDIEQLPPEWRAGGAEWRKASAALYGRMRGMMVDVLVQLKKDYPESYGDYTPRPANLIGWMTRQIADVYTTPAAIRYVSEDGKDVPKDVATTSTAIRQAAGTDAAMLASHEEAVGTGNGIILTQPVIRHLEGGGELLGVHHLVVQAHDCMWELAEHPESLDEKDLTTFWVRLPVPGMNKGQVNSTAIAVLTKTHAKWLDGPLAGKPIWPRRLGDEEGLNPFGQIPITVIRWCDPVPGDFMALARADALWQARALDAGYTSMGETDKVQGFGQWIGKLLGLGGGKLKFGRHEVVDLPDALSDLKNVAPQNNQQASLASLEGYMRTSLATQDLNPASMLRSTALTAEGKREEVNDRDNLRQRHLPQLMRAEQRLYNLRRAGLAKLRGRDVLPRATLVVEYSSPFRPGNDLQSVQAEERKLALGQENPFTLYAANKRVPLAEAETRVRENLKITRELLGGLPTGGSSMTTPQQGTKPTEGETKPTEATDAAKVTSSPNAAPVGDIQKTALNGAQFDTLVQTVLLVVQGQISADTARALINIANPGVDQDEVEKALASAKGFKQRTIEPAPVPA